MKRVLFIFLILLTLTFSISAQTEEARKIDEFENIPCDDYLMRMDAAMIESQKNPFSKLYVLIYEGKEAKYNRRKKRTELISPSIGSAKAKFDSIKDYAKTRRFSTENFLFIEAGFREKLAVELWVVPTGAAPPKPTPTLTKMKYRKGKPERFCTDCCGL